MLLRVVRTVLGAVLLLVGVPLLLAGGLLYFAGQHQHPSGGFAAPLAPIATAGHAVVATDLDGLLRREVPFARGDQTTLRLHAQTRSGAPAFIGLAPAADAAAYLRGVRYARVEQIQLGQGPLPVVTSPVAGDRAPAGPPAAQSFWLVSSGTGTLEWRPHERSGEQLALVVMDPAGSAPLSVALTAQVELHWLHTTTAGLLGLGGVALAVAVLVLVWPGRRARQIIYVVDPQQLPEIAAHLGVAVPRDAPAAPAEPLADGLPAGPPEAGPPVEWPTALLRPPTATPVTVPAQPPGPRHPE